MTIGEKIRVLRRDKNMSQSELAKVLGVTNQAISKWEKDISNPDISLLPDLAACFGVAIDDLFASVIVKKRMIFANMMFIRSGQQMA